MKRQWRYHGLILMTVMAGGIAYLLCCSLIMERHHVISVSHTDHRYRLLPSEGRAGRTEELLSQSKQVKKPDHSTPSMNPDFIPNKHALPSINAETVPNKQVTPTVNPEPIPNKQVTPTVNPEFIPNKHVTPSVNFESFLSKYMTTFVNTEIVPHKHMTLPVNPEDIPKIHVNPNSIPVHLYRKPEDLADAFRDCAYKCHETTDFPKEENAAVVFYAPALYDDVSLKKRHGQIWIYYTLEPPWLHPAPHKLDLWTDVFNWTAGYRRDADIMIPYGKFKTLPKNHQSDHFNLGWNLKLNKSVQFISNCRVPSQRQLYVQRLDKLYKTDIYGRCGNLSCPKSEWSKCNKKIKSYTFYLAFENSLCRDYVTEKIYKLFTDNINTIPVGRGPDNYELFFPHNSYIDTKNFPTIESLGKYMLYLSRNATAATNYFKWKEHYYVEEIDYYKPFCEICRRLHDPLLLHKYRRLYHNINSWLRGNENKMCK